MKLRMLIVDDEPPARARVRALASDCGDFEIVGEAANGDDAIRFIGELRPNLVFLDVEMPPPDGLEVLRTVRDEVRPAVVFTTAHAQHAVAAFEADALDYLLKPFSPERFAVAVDRARSRLADLRSGGRDDPIFASLAARSTPATRFLVKMGDRHVVVRTSEIRWIEAAANYVVLHAVHGRTILRRPISTLETELDSKLFFRASRSAIVNLEEVLEVRMLDQGGHVIVLRDGTRVQLTRSLRELQERLVR